MTPDAVQDPSRLELEPWGAPHELRPTFHGRHDRRPRDGARHGRPRRRPREWAGGRGHWSPRGSRAPAWRSAEGRTVWVGWLEDGDGARVDQVVCVVWRGPHSSTGEDVVEVTCHGGDAVAQAVLRTLYDGGRPAGRRRARSRSARFLNGKLDLAQAEAVADLIHAESRPRPPRRRRPAPGPRLRGRRGRPCLARPDGRVRRARARLQRRGTSRSPTAPRSAGSSTRPTPC